MGVPFAVFIAPGLIMMGMLQNAFANSSFSLLVGKIQGNIIDYLMPPLSTGELIDVDLLDCHRANIPSVPLGGRQLVVRALGPVLAGVARLVEHEALRFDPRAPVVTRREPVPSHPPPVQK